MKLRTLLATTALSLGVAAPTWAADHADSPATAAEPLADIADLYAWMTPEADKLNLIITLSPFASVDTQWSDSVIYAFHVNSGMAYGGEQSETTILCKFYDATNIECWAGDEYVTGAPSDPAGIASESGALKVFAGLRDDPFFMELAGFQAAVGAVIEAAPNLQFDAAGCPALDEATSAVLVGLLAGGQDGASDTLAGANTMALVVQVDKALVTGGGPLLGVWASTHAPAN
ncbi:MAG: DUF4331 family protein [Myxococcales bacterium]|nr:DUF4331 family protein [Myxococcales bacterium]